MHVSAAVPVPDACAFLSLNYDGNTADVHSLTWLLQFVRGNLLSKMDVMNINKINSKHFKWKENSLVHILYQCRERVDIVRTRVQILSSIFFFFCVRVFFCLSPPTSWFLFPPVGLNFWQALSMWWDSPRKLQISIVFFFFFSPVTCGVLVPWPGFEPGSLAVKAQSPNHWTAREFPHSCYNS